MNKKPRQASGRDQRPQYSRARPMQGSNRNQPDLWSRAGLDRSDEPWRQDSLWKCAVKGCDHPGTYTFLALEKHFMHWHQPQHVEYVCPFGGYRCPFKPCSAHNPEPAMGHDRTAICRGLQSGNEGPWRLAQVPMESAVWSSTSQLFFYFFIYLKHIFTR